LEQSFIKKDLSNTPFHPSDTQYIFIISGLPLWRPFYGKGFKQHKKGRKERILIFIFLDLNKEL